MTISNNAAVLALLTEAAQLIELPDTRQEQLDLTGEHQAIEAFMEERQDLKDDLRYAKYEVNVLAEHLEEEIARTQRLEREADLAAKDVEKAIETLLQVAEYVGQLKELLGRIGISVGYDDAEAKPQLLIDRAQLAFRLNNAFPA